MLSRITIDQLLAGLPDADRVMLLLIYQVELPADWGNRAVTYAEIGAYIGTRFEGKPLSEAAIRYRRDEIIKLLRGERGDLRRSLRRA